METVHSGRRAAYRVFVAVIWATATVAFRAVPAQEPVLRAAPESYPPLLRELLKLNERYIEAARNDDIATMRALTTDDYVAVNPYFLYMLEDEDKYLDEEKAWAAYFKPEGGDEVVIRREAMPRAKRYGDVAILAYVELEAVKTRGDRVRGGRSGKCTFIYHRVGRKWLLANSFITAQALPETTVVGDSR